ncbi:hypothetical protein ACOHX9_000099 [Yersinia enterocolitica]|nr:hypothetical protein [Yersinia enterocolitica]HDL7089581.1 hypothetical protein [Yersinia enterocolitica]HDM8093510.1 hypothetical protein [Yersinia enterocolitica]
MDKYEKRRLRLIQIRDEICGGKAAEVARRISREPSYVSRMLYPEGKKGKKRIADDMVELLETSFKLPRGWLDEIFPQENTKQNNKKYEITPDEEEVLELFRGLPDDEAKRFKNEMKARKAHFDAIFEEMLKKRQLGA